MTGPENLAACVDGGRWWPRPFQHLKDRPVAGQFPGAEDEDDRSSIGGKHGAALGLVEAVRCRIAGVVGDQDASGHGDRGGVAVVESIWSGSLLRVDVVWFELEHRAPDERGTRLQVLVHGLSQLDP